MIIHKGYTEETFKNNLVEQGAVVTFKFPNTFTTQMYEEWLQDKSKLHPTCGCTNYSVEPELNQITFKITAPSFNTKLNEPFPKSVTPYYKGVENVQWEIKFLVNHNKT